ncbi:MAG: hypothetical protein WC767_03520 [Candidatus Paceibacterota bacterium]|jgi:hypothetical protein
MNYYVNKESLENGDHEVHRGDCPVLPKEGKLIHLGDFLLCSSALAEAKKHFVQINACETCSKFHHEKTD